MLLTQQSNKRLDQVKVVESAPTNARKYPRHKSLHNPTRSVANRLISAALRLNMNGKPKKCTGKLRVITRLGAMLSIACTMTASTCAETSHSQEPTPKERVYISNYAGAEVGGIYLAELNLETGELQLIKLVADLKKASFLALHPNHHYLYATGEVGDYLDSKGGALLAFEIDAHTGNLTLLNHQSSGGAGPCYVSLDRDGKHALVANYDGGNVAVLPIGADGKLNPASSTVMNHGSSVNKVRQTEPHPHAINVDPASRFVFVPDLGLDKVLAFRFDTAKGTLAPNNPGAVTAKPGAGPRHIAFHPKGDWAYVINELDSTVAVLRYDPETGVLTPLETVSTLPTRTTTDNITGEIVVHPHGRFLYASNRGHDSIAVYAINNSTGRLTLLGHHPAGGRVPRNFNIDPTGRFLLAANMDSDSVTIHQIDLATGKLSQLSREIKIVQPYCIEFAP